MSLQLLSSGLLVVLLGQLPKPLDAEGFSAAVQKDTILVTVRVVNTKNGDSGFGVLLKSGDILTAAHLVEGTEAVDVHVFDAKSYPKPTRILKSLPVTARGRDRQPDLALVSLDLYKDYYKGGVDVCALKNVPPKDKKFGKFVALAAGCGREEEPTLRQLSVLDAGSFIIPKEKRAGYYFRTAEKSVKGESGGPLINAKGQLIGICSGTTRENGYFCHLEDIHPFLKKEGLGKLLKEP
jgi:hypothetical protein